MKKVLLYGIGGILIIDGLSLLEFKHHIWDVIMVIIAFAG